MAGGEHYGNQDYTETDAGKKGMINIKASILASVQQRV